MKKNSKKISSIFRIESDDPLEFEYLRKGLLLRLFISSGIILFTIYVILNIIRNDYTIVAINIVSVLALSISLIFVINKKYIELISVFSSIYITLHLIFINIFAPNHLTSLIWSILQPPVVLFLTGKKKGVLLILFFLSFLVLYYSVISDNFTQKQFSTFTIEYYSAFFMIIALSYIYELIREKSQKQLIYLNQKVNETNQELTNTYQALIKSQITYRTLVETAIDGIVMIENYIITYANQSFLNLIDMKEIDVIGSEFQYFVEQSERQRVKKIHDLRLRSPFPLEPYETVFINSNSNKIYVDINAAVIRTNENNTVIAFIRDVSNKKVQEEQKEALILELENNRDTIIKDSDRLRKLNDKLRLSEDNLKDIIAMKDRFLSVLSHDLKNPLSGSKLLIDMLYDEFEEMTKEEVVEVLSNLKISATSVNELLSNLLHWIRSQSDNMKLDPIEFNVKEIAELTFESLQTQAAQKNIKLIDNIDESAQVFADIDMVKSVFRNLITNAIKFTPEFGEIYLNSIMHDEEWEINIIDTGVGIPEDKIALLFREDTTFTTPGTNEERGSGFGLMLCKEFIEKNNGRLWVNSEIDFGSNFRFTLPKI